MSPDAGKYQAASQRYIGRDPELSNEGGASCHSVPHSAAGAALALQRFGARDPRAALLALVIEAHHGALKSARAIAGVVAQRGTPLLQAARQGGFPMDREAEPLAPIRWPSALGVRMLFSALVDADLLDTERWDRGYRRAERGEPLPVLRNRLARACGDANGLELHSDLEPAQDTDRNRQVCEN